MKYLLLALLLGGCAPLSKSVPKSTLCEIPSEYQSRYDSVQNGSTWNTVIDAMGEQPTVDGDMQIYVHCKQMIFMFTGNVLQSKSIR